MVSPDSQILFADCTKTNQDGTSQAFSVASASSGTPLWNFTYDERVPVMSPDGRSVFVEGKDANGGWNLYAVASTDGTPRWKVSIDYDADLLTPGVSPDSHTVYIGPGYAPVNNTIYALDATDGTERWKLAFGGAPLCTGLVVSADGRTMYVGSTQGILYAVDATAGTPRWKFVAPTGYEINFDPVVSPDSQTVYVGTYVNHEGYNPSLYAVNAITGTVLWTHTNIYGSETNKPVVSPDSRVVYYVEGSGIGAINATNGKLIWSFGGPSYPAPLLSPSGEVLYALGYMALYAIETANGTKLWDWSPSDGDAEFDQGMGLSPDGQALFLGISDESNSTFYALNINDGVLH